MQLGIQCQFDSYLIFIFWGGGGSLHLSDDTILLNCCDNQSIFTSNFSNTKSGPMFTLYCINAIKSIYTFLYWTIVEFILNKNNLIKVSEIDK